MALSKALFTVIIQNSTKQLFSKPESESESKLVKIVHIKKIFFSSMTDLKFGWKKYHTQVFGL